MSDLISRAAAVDALKNQMSDWNDDYNVPVRKSIEILGRLPSAQPDNSYSDGFADGYKRGLIDAQPERKKGRWIEREVTHIDDLEAKDIITAWQSCKCSVCGRYDTKPYMYYFNAPKYCSWCGAEMEVSE